MASRACTQTLAAFNLTENFPKLVQILIIFYVYIALLSIEAYLKLLKLRLKFFTLTNV